MTGSGGTSIAERLSLADWRRQVADLYAEVRRTAASDPHGAWTLWRTARERLFREHPDSPVPAGLRGAFRAHHWPYDERLRFVLPVLDEPAEPEAHAGIRLSLAPGESLQLPMSVGDALDFRRIGWIEVPFTPGPRRLALYWMAGYAGGLFLPFRDATNGDTTYAAGRYLLDTAKSADLGVDPASRLVIDFNFAFHPSCAFDPVWSCPLAPPENRLDLPVEAGERLR
ncbi:MAG TPA: DUF1684 domain-containing protein [Candidatus Limnocylindrales bacterium]|nr:DUF1684 domain-containing protein [Candidatus Limnocylindrales bacterium]